MVRFSLTLLMLAAALGACAASGFGAYGRGYGGASPPPARAAFPEVAYATWQDEEPEYRLYPGDVLDVAVLSAPELNRTVTVQPDGRITLPLVPPLMVADRSVPQVKAMLGQAYASQLVRPEVDVNLKTSTPLKVFVGGWVDKPGVYDMPGDIDALQAVIMAGGFRLGAKSNSVVLLRRGPGGGAMMRTLDLRGASGGRFVVEQAPLRRFDVLYVPKTSLAELGGFVSQLRDALPFQFSYVINGQYVSTR